MTPLELKQLRRKMGLDEVQFATELGYVGSNRNLKTIISQYERGYKSPIPTYIARLAYMISEHWEVEEGCLPEWPASCALNPRRENGDGK
jgi:hypothetical protein